MSPHDLLFGVLIPIASWACGYVLGQSWRTDSPAKAALPGPVNVVDGIVLPEPSDPRWHPLRELQKCNEGQCRWQQHRVVRLGRVRVPLGCRRIVIDHVAYDGDEAHRYVREVTREFSGRLALEAIQETP